LALTGHWIGRDWKLQTILLDFIHICGQHTGVNLAGYILESLKRIGLLKKVSVFSVAAHCSCVLTTFCLQVIAIPTDSASNNDTLMRTLAKDDGVNEDFDAIHSHVRCFAHVLHLAVKAGMKELRLPDVDPDAMAAAAAADRAPVKKVSAIDRDAH
jgi:hypothetical protein